MTIKEGDKIPSVTFMTPTTEGPKPVNAAEFFADKKVVLFGVPGAFTPTCSAKHLPSFLANAKAIKDKGVDVIACVAPNDVFVMGAWGKSQRVGKKVMMLADGSNNFAKAAGLDLDLTERGMGSRMKRFAIIVDHGVVKKVAVEPNPGQLEVSSGEAMLKAL